MCSGATFVGSNLHPRGSLRRQVKVPGSQHPSAAGFKGHGGFRLGFSMCPASSGCARGLQVNTDRFLSVGKVIGACRRSPLRPGRCHRRKLRKLTHSGSTSEARLQSEPVHICTGLKGSHILPMAGPRDGRSNELQP